MATLCVNSWIKPEITARQIRAELEHRREQIAKLRPRDRTIYSDILTADQLAYAQEVANMLHEYGARSVDAYVLMLEEMLAYFESRIEKEE